MMQVATDILTNLPPDFDMDQTRKQFGINISPTTVVLFQVSTMNMLSFIPEHAHILELLRVTLFCDLTNGCDPAHGHWSC